MVNVSVNDVVNVRASCLSLSMSACRQRWTFLRIGFDRCACADESTQSTEFLCLDVRSSMVLPMSSIYCWSLFGGRCIAAIMMCLLLLRQEVYFSDSHF